MARSLPDQRNKAAREAWLNEPVPVMLPRRTWLVVVGAARDFDTRVPLEQGDGGECLDTILAAVHAASDEIVPVDSWCEHCGRKHMMRGQVENCARCGGDRFVFSPPASDEEEQRNGR